MIGQIVKVVYLIIGQCKMHLKLHMAQYNGDSQSVIPFHLCTVLNLPHNVVNSPANAEMLNAHY